MHATRTVERHPLANLPTARKVLATAGLLLGFSVLLAATMFELLITQWGTSLMDVRWWGSSLLEVRGRSPALFYGLFAAHAICLGLVIGIARSLFGKLAWPEKARRFVFGLAVGFAVVDLCAWLALPSLGMANEALGFLVGIACVFALAVSWPPMKEMWIYRRWHTSLTKPKRVVIVGGGFAGLYAALELDRRLGYHSMLEIVVIDRKNYFLFPPLLPSVATGAIETRQVTYPFRRIFEATNVTFRMEHVESIDTARRVVRSRVDVDVVPETGEHRIIRNETEYDYLVLAPGSDANTFGTPGVAENAYFMRELSDAVAVRNQIIDCFERAAREADDDHRREHLSFVIVGAGPTGVELAAEVNDLIEHILHKRYPEVAPDLVSVTVVQSGNRILPGWNDRVAEAAAGQLRRLRIRILLNRRVTAVGPDSVALDGNEVLKTRTCVWCAGVRPSPLMKHSGFPLHASGRVEIGEDLRVRGFDDAFVLGDSSYLVENGKPLPPLGQVAFQQGSHAGRNLERLLRGKSPRPFRYFNHGALVSVGEYFAAVDLMGVRLTGAVAWFVWRTLYLAKLVGFGNKVRVVLDWTLDLLVERSISQISAPRRDPSSHASDIRSSTENSSPKTAA